MSKRRLQPSRAFRKLWFCALAFPLFLSFILGLSPKVSAAQPTSEIEIEGTVEVLHEDREIGSRYIYFLNTAAERLELRFVTQPPALVSGDRVRARGTRSNGGLALSSASSVQTLSAALPNTFGAQKTIVILVDFYDNPVQPYTVAHAQTVFNTTSNFKSENSFSQTWLTGVVDPSATADIYGWFTINQSSTICDYNTTASLAEKAAAVAGANLSQYTRRVYARPSAHCRPELYGS